MQTRTPQTRNPEPARAGGVIRLPPKAARADGQKDAEPSFTIGPSRAGPKLVRSRMRVAVSSQVIDLPALAEIPLGTGHGRHEQFGAGNKAVRPLPDLGILGFDGHHADRRVVG